MDARPTEHELADGLAKVVRDAGVATLIATRAGFRPELLPAFTQPLTFWSDVVEKASRGMCPVEALVAKALELYPHAVELRALAQRLDRATSLVSVPAPIHKLSAHEFASLLDRHSPWSRFCERCKSDEHLVTWVAGDPRQDLSLFYERIRSELSLVVEHHCYEFGTALGDGTVAAEWERELLRVVPGYHRGMTPAQALRVAASQRPAIFLLRNHRGALEDDALSEPYVDELVEFVAKRFVPAAMAVPPDDPPVRLFLAIQTARGQRKAKLAKALRAAMAKAMKAHRGRLGMWEEEEIELPTWNDVKASVEEHMPRRQPLDEDEIEAIERAYDAFRTKEGGALHELARAIYPLYEGLYDARTRSTSNG